MLKNTLIETLLDAGEMKELKKKFIEAVAEQFKEDLENGNYYFIDPEEISDIMSEIKEEIKEEIKQKYKQELMKKFEQDFGGKF